MTINPEAEAAARAQNNAVLIAALDEKGPADVDPSWDLHVLNDAEHGRWTATLDAETIAELPYQYLGGRVVLLSTWVDPVHRNNRVATKLIAHVLDEIRKAGKKITIICPVVGRFIARHPKHADLVDNVRPGAGATPSTNPSKAATTMSSPSTTPYLRGRSGLVADGRLVPALGIRQCEPN